MNMLMFTNICGKIYPLVLKRRQIRIFQEKGIGKRSIPKQSEMIQAHIINENLDANLSS